MNPRPFLAFLLASASLMAQAPEDMLPASSYGYLSFAGTGAAARAAREMPARDLVRSVLDALPEDVRQGVVEARLEQAADVVERGLRELGVGPATLRSLLQRPMAIGVGRLTLGGMGLSVALLIDCKEHGDDVEAMAGALFDLAKRRVRDLAAEDVEFAGARLCAIKRTGEPMFDLLAGRIGDYWVLTNSRGYLREIADVMSGAKHGITRVPSVSESRGRSPALASCFLNTGPSLSVLEPHLPYEAAAVGEALGLSGLDGVYAELSASSSGGRQLLHFGLAGNPEGLLKTAFRGPLTFEAAKWCSPKAACFATASMDLAAIEPAFEAFSEALPLWMRSRLNAAWRGAGRGLRRSGIDRAELERLFGALGPRVSLAVDLAPLPIPIPEPLLFVEVRDWEVVKPWLDRLEDSVARAAGSEWRVREANGASIRYCEVRPEGGIRLAPCYVHRDGMLVISSQVQNLLSALGRHADPSGGSLFTEPDFAAAVQANPHANAFAHLRWFQAAEIGWRFVETNAGRILDAKADEIGFGSEVLPDRDTVAKALGACTIAARINRSGVTLVSTGSLGAASWLAACCACIDEILARAAGRIF
ncbi:MAG: hypothetical protein Fur0037_27830 [Planctomycetota bacterium]